MELNGGANCRYCWQSHCDCSEYSEDEDYFLNTDLDFEVEVNESLVA